MEAKLKAIRLTALIGGLEMIIGMLIGYLQYFTRLNISLYFVGTVVFLLGYYTMFFKLNKLLINAYPYGRIIEDK